MQPDPVRVADTREWLAKASRDLGAGRRNLAGEPAYTGDAMFHAQQAVEKALKAFLTWHEVPFRKTHDLRELFESCSAIDPTLASLREEAEGLTPYAWVFHYPGDLEEPPQEEADATLELARRAYDAIVMRLPADVRLADTSAAGGDPA